MLADAHQRGLGFSGVVWRSAAPVGHETTAEATARMEARIANLLSAVHTVQGGEVKLPGGLGIVTERAVATESGEPVDPVQAGCWGFGRTRSTKSRCCAAGWWTATAPRRPWTPW